MQIWEIGTIKVIELWYIYLIEIKIAINAKINSILLQKIHVHKMAKKCVFYSSKLDQNIYGELMLHIDIKELLLRALNFFLCSTFKFQCMNYDIILSFVAKIRLRCLNNHQISRSIWTPINRNHPITTLGVRHKNYKR